MPSAFSVAETLAETSRHTLMELPVRRQACIPVVPRSIFAPLLIAAIFLNVLNLLLAFGQISPVGRVLVQHRAAYSPAGCRLGNLELNQSYQTLECQQDGVRYPHSTSIHAAPPLTPNDDS